jgi:hypothetical protein
LPERQFLGQNRRQAGIAGEKSGMENGGRVFFHPEGNFLPP